jgi:archaellum component FlaC
MNGNQANYGESKNYRSQSPYENQEYNSAGFSDDAVFKIRDLEEKQKILKDRLLLVGQNLIDFKEKNQEDMITIKKEIEIIKGNVERITSFLEMVSGELSKFARKDDLDILAKQVKMLQAFKENQKK